MNPEANNISLTLHHLGESHRIQTCHGQYHSLLALISENLAIPGFGICGGMGSCGTCLVKIGDQHSAIKRNVLACCIQVNDDLSNKDVIIPDKIY
ncbi:2Fe-2S iron-sulfur cluster-binding protein [Mucilaginibacter sp. AW1-3]